MSGKLKKYNPIKLPRKRRSNPTNWFDIIDAANNYSIKHASLWQDKGYFRVRGWAVMNPKGRILPSTFSVRRNTAKARCMEPALQKFKGIISHLFREWEKKGYKVVKVRWEVY